MSQVQTMERVGTSPLSDRDASRMAAVGATVLATCFCSIDRIAFGAGGTGMLGTRFGLNLYTSIFLFALALILVGLTFRARAARLPALTGVLLLAGGLMLSPPSSMHYTTPTLSEIAGFVLMLGGAGALVWGFLRAWPTRRPGAAAVAAGGFGAAAGCACCVASGAVAGFMVSVGFTMPAAPWQDGIFFVPFMALAVAGLYRLAGARWALIALAGAVIAFGGDEGLKPLLAPEVALLPRLVVTLAGTGLVVWAFAGAFGQMSRGEPAVRTGSAPDSPLLGSRAGA